MDAAKCTGIINPSVFPMKKLMTKLEAFLLGVSLIKDCEFKRGLRIRPKSANLVATGRTTA